MDEELEDAGDLMFGYINFQGIQGEVTRKIISNDSSKEIKSLQKTYLLDD